MADAIVQTIKIEVEGGDEAAEALNKVGESATSSFEETQKAAETAGVSIEDFGKLSEKTQQAYIELSQRVADGSQEIVASTQQVQQAASGAQAGTRDLGGGLDDVSEKSGISSREMRGLGKIMKELGAGEAAGLAVSFGKVASSLGALGAVALAVAMATGAVMKFAKETLDASKAFGELAAASGTPIEALKNLEGAFESAGLSSKKFAETFSAMTLTLIRDAPKIAGQIAETAQKAADAQAAFQKASLEPRSLQLQGQALEQASQKFVFQTEQLRLQGQQLQANLQSIQTQIQYSDQLVAIERNRVNLTVQDAEANLKTLLLKRQFLRGNISEEDFQRRTAQLEAQAFNRAIEKARVDLENAKLQQEMLPKQQAAQQEALQLQRQQAELALQQFPLQQQALELQKEQNDLARKRLEIDQRRFDLETGQKKSPDDPKEGLKQTTEATIALQKANEALANSLGPVIELYKQMAQGLSVSINPLTSVETQAKALIAVMAELGIAVEDMGKGFDGAGVAWQRVLPVLARMFDDLTELQKLNLAEVMKKAGIPPEVITSLKKGSAEFARLREEAAKIQWARDQLEDFGRAADTSALKAQRWGIILGGIAVIALKVVGGLLHLIIDPIIAFAEGLSGGFAGAIAGFMASLGTTLHMLIDPLLAKFKQEIEQWVTTPVANAWQWIVGTFNAALALIESAIAEATAFIQQWVTTPIGNAWQWIVDAFTSVVWVPLESAANAVTEFIKAWVTTPVANAWQWIVDKWNAMLAKLGLGGGGTPAPAGTTGGGFAGGGLLGGRGTGTSDSNLAWVSRGEHIMPARAVAQPGVLAFLEALRRSGGNLRGVLDGMGRFALGGLVAPTISIPAFAGGGMNNVTINFPGLPEITGLRASSAVVDELRKAAAMAQVRSGGRKPSRYS